MDTPMPPDILNNKMKADNTFTETKTRGDPWWWMVVAVILIILLLVTLRPDPFMRILLFVKDGQLGSFFLGTREFSESYKLL